MPQMNAACRAAEVRASPERQHAKELDLCCNSRSRQSSYSSHGRHDHAKNSQRSCCACPMTASQLGS
eukprot:4787400-Pleurochrysis_carterae.AAC.1